MIRKSEIDNLKGLAIIGVVFVHMSFYSRFSAETIKIIDFLQLIFGWCVIAFFFSAGLVSKKVKREYLIDFSRKKFKRLIIPCFYFSLTYKLILAVISYLGFSSYSSIIPDTLIDLSLFIIAPVGPQFYFLYYLFACSMISIALELFLSRNMICIFAIFVLPILFYFIESPINSYGPDLNLIPIYLYSYILGMLFSKCNSKNLNKLYAFSSLSISLVILIITNNQYLVFIQIYIPIIIWLSFIKLSSISSLFNKTKLGMYSGGIYVWHTPIVLPIVSVFFTYLIGGGSLVILPIIIFTILISILMSRLTYKYDFLKFLRF